MGEAADGEALDDSATDGEATDDAPVLAFSDLKLIPVRNPEETENMSPNRNAKRVLMRRMILITTLIAFIFTVALLTGTVTARPYDGQSSDQIWYDVDGKSVVGQGDRLIVPDRYRILGVNYAALADRLDRAPLEFTPAAYNTDTILALPLPDGSFQRFRIFESPIMAPGLAAKFPDLSTYSAIGVDDVHASGRLDLTSAGFHAMIFSTSGTFYIDPFSREQPDLAISYFKSDFSAPEDLVYEELGPLGNPESVPVDGPVMSGETLRTYRLALATTGEYSIFHGGTVPLVMAELVTAINRVTGIYEREVAIRLELISNNDLLIYLNPATDPYTNNSGGAMLGQNQTTIDNVIGDANYDIGHVFSTGGGGVAYLNAVCVSGIKARGVTGLSSPVGDPFYVDYVAHEMGHQHGGNHPFNGNAGACTGGNRNPSTAYEPGSGSTIMAYAGICGSQNIQSNSDDYFHTVNFEEIFSFTTAGSGSNCGTVTSTGNNAPVADAGTGGFTIPIETPFTLTGSGFDQDNEPLSYNWEEFDLGPAGHPNSPQGNAPIFRSFTALTTPSRTFPRISDIVNNTQTIGEILPTYARDLTFRLTVRDNHAYPSAGGVDYDTIAFDVTNQAGPFLVIQPNTAIDWQIGTLQEVVWDAANTDAPPVSCSSVDILLSTDGGYTYPQLLASGAANDGRQLVPVPNLPSSSARVKVECADNIFFDISDTNFTISTGPPFTSLSATKSVDPATNLAPGVVLTYTIDVFNSGNVTATATVTDTFAATLVNPVCDGVPGDLHDQHDIPGGSWKTYECTAQVDPSLHIELNKVVDEPNPISGTTVTYTITVTNPNTSTAIDEVLVSDPGVGVCTPDLGIPVSLDPLASQIYTCPDVLVTGDTTNTADVSGKVTIDNVATAFAPEDPSSPVSSNTVQNVVDLYASDSVTVTVQFASLTVTKIVNTESDLAPGDALTYTITITNSGNLTATTTVTDTFVATLVNPVCEGVPGDLDDQSEIPGATWKTYECTAQVDSSLHIELNKVVDDPNPIGATTVTYTITVTNPNTSTSIDEILVSDPGVGDCTPDLGIPISLGPLASQSYICPDVLVTGSTTNTADVSGEVTIDNVATAYAPEDTSSPVSSNIVQNVVDLYASDSATVTVTFYETYLPTLMKDTTSTSVPESPVTASPLTAAGFTAALAGIGTVLIRRRPS